MKSYLVYERGLGCCVGVLRDELCTAAVGLDHLRQQPQDTGLGHQRTLLLLVLAARPRLLLLGLILRRLRLALYNSMASHYSYKLYQCICYFRLP